MLLIGETPAGIYLSKVNGSNVRTMREICSKLTIMAPEQLQWRLYYVFTVNFEQISFNILVFQLLTLKN